MVDNMRRSLIDKYGSDRDVTDAWDQLQTEVEKNNFPTRSTPDKLQLFSSIFFCSHAQQGQSEL